MRRTNRQALILSGFCIMIISSMILVFHFTGPVRILRSKGTEIQKPEPGIFGAKWANQDYLGVGVITFGAGLVLLVIPQVFKERVNITQYHGHPQWEDEEEYDADEYQEDEDDISEENEEDFQEYITCKGCGKVHLIPANFNKTLARCKRCRTLMRLPPSAIDPGLVGIGGWLIIPAIGLALSAIGGIVSWIKNFGLYSDFAGAGLVVEYLVWCLLELSLLVFLVYTSVLFFGKKRHAPLSIITLMLAAFGFSLISFAIDLGSGITVIGSFIHAAIWIPYFLISVRVKATFVN